MMRHIGLVGTLVLLAVAGCAQSTPRQSSPPRSGPAQHSPAVNTSPSSPSQSPCRSTPPTRVLSVRNRNETIPVELLGTGKVTVVLSNQSDEDRCSWLPFTRTLVSRGFRVALWEYAMYPAPEELAAIAPAVHRDGGGDVILMGASKGATTGLTTATLLVTAAEDPYGSAEALAPIRHGLRHAQVVRVPGSDHGTALLTNATVSSTVLRFLR